MKKFGVFKWIDLSVENADQVRDFYGKVVGWTSQGLSMGDYEDYMIMDSEGNPVSGICFKKGANSKIPSQWLNYVTVEDLESSVQSCTELGGKIIDGPRGEGAHRFVVIQDPAGAYLALMQAQEE